MNYKAAIFDMDGLLLDTERVCQRAFQAIAIKEGVVDLLKWLTEQSIPIAIATSSDKKVAMTKLKLAGLEGYFEQISTGCEITHSKPHPEIFLLAASRLNIDPKDCLAFEDSSNGVRSAISAGMQVYQVPDLVKPCYEILALGHNISGSLAQVLNKFKSELG